MTREEYHHWLTHVFKGKDKCQLLVVDSYKPHVSDESREIVTSKCNSSLVITPEGCTSIVQPMGRQAVQRRHEGELDGMDEVRPSHNKNGQPKTWKLITAIWSKFMEFLRMQVCLYLHLWAMRGALGIGLALIIILVESGCSMHFHNCTWS